ncbi:hypothetical protein [Desulfocurvibacter africanus]|uniref:hypothetical protein n=1 Tax=Desulfocurvibacter africanus TaxID=873 RepID=UPI000403C4A7|nr:hypothetical protein [Desulfocurvibacter africanus]
MLLTPAVLALLVGSALLSLTMLLSSAVGLEIIRRWDPSSGSPAQLALERRTYLVSLAVSVVMAFELMSLLLLAHAGEDLHVLFSGAMCAAGTFNVNDYGYPALILKLANSLLCGVWLILNHADNQAPDYPLIRIKYTLLLPITLFVLMEAALQLGFFRKMRPDLITSCCGALFSEGSPSVAGAMAGLPSAFTQTVFYTSTLLLARAGLRVLRTNRSAGFFSCLSLWLLVWSLVAVISFVSVHYYELPTHHCPFCLLQRDYGFVGYPMYILLLTGSIAGAGVGAVERYGSAPSLRELTPSLQRSLVKTSLAGHLGFAALTLYPLLFSSFRLRGY